MASLALLLPGAALGLGATLATQQPPPPTLRHPALHRPGWPPHARRSTQHSAARLRPRAPAGPPAPLGSDTPLASPGVWSHPTPWGAGRTSCLWSHRLPGARGGPRVSGPHAGACCAWGAGPGAHGAARPGRMVQPGLGRPCCAWGPVQWPPGHQRRAKGCSWAVLEQRTSPPGEGACSSKSPDPRGGLQHPSPAGTRLGSRPGACGLAGRGGGRRGWDVGRAQQARGRGQGGVGAGMLLAVAAACSAGFGVGAAYAYHLRRACCARPGGSGVCRAQRRRGRQGDRRGGRGGRPHGTQSPRGIKCNIPTKHAE